MSGVLFISLVFIEVAHACRSACFADDSSHYVVKSFDFHIEGGHFFSRPPQVSKIALVSRDEFQPLKWTSKYESLTFSQIGPDFPFGGLNSQGVVVEALWLASSGSPALTSGVPTVNESQYLQYILDTAATVDEALRLTKQLQIERVIAPLHYLMCDASRVCAVVEMKSQGLQTRLLQQPEDQVLENVPHELMVRKDSRNPIRLLFLEHRQQIKNSLEGAFQWLEKVKTPGWSRWQIVYDLKSLKLHFQGLKPSGSPDRRVSLEFSKTKVAAEARAWDTAGPLKWDRARFRKNFMAFAKGFPQILPFQERLEKSLEKSFEQ